MIIDAENRYEDNLLKFMAQIPVKVKCKASGNSTINIQEFYILASNTMLMQLEESQQWFIDGTFQVPPMGFQQLVTVIVFLPRWNVFYPGCFILCTNKSKKLYTRKQFHPQAQILIGICKIFRSLSSKRKFTVL